MHYFDTVHFTASKAKTVAITFNHWASTEVNRVYTDTIEGVQPYEPGSFYKRELPCIVSILAQISLDEIKFIVIDGFVILDDDNTPGLGAHLYAHLDYLIPVIGVAKTNFAPINQLKREVKRGQSNNPLYVTALGMDLDVAANYIRMMSGEYRIPVLLKTLDSLTRANK